MAPRKGKSQGKRNDIKIKSGLDTKRGVKPMKKSQIEEKPLENLKWLNKIQADGAVKECETIPNWLNACVYKRSRSNTSVARSSEYHSYPPNDTEDKSTSSDASDECNCAHSKYSDTKCGILKRKFSSTNSIVAKYIKSGMDHVASFIVESAIRFGEKHGVVIPDKNAPNVYEITPPERRFEEKNRKIRFKIPGKPIRDENLKKMAWRNHLKANACRRAQSPEDKEWKFHKSNSSSWVSTEDSLEDILPLLEKLKEGGGGIVTSELDLDNLARLKEAEEYVRKRERIRDKLRTMEKRYKSVGDVSDKGSDEPDYTIKHPWKRFQRDSLELGRQRLRSSACSRKQEASPPPY